MSKTFKKSAILSHVVTGNNVRWCQHCQHHGTVQQTVTRMTAMQANQWQAREKLASRSGQRLASACIDNPVIQPVQWVLTVAAANGWQEIYIKSNNLVSAASVVVLCQHWQCHGGTAQWAVTATAMLQAAQQMKGETSMKQHTTNTTHTVARGGSCSKGKEYEKFFEGNNQPEAASVRSGTRGDISIGAVMCNAVSG